VPIDSVVSQPDASHEIPSDKLGSHR
jgi:hypothetical protein